MGLNARILAEFARELKKVVEEFEEEMENLSNKELMEEIKRNEEAKKKGEVVTFDSIEELKN